MFAARYFVRLLPVIRCVKSDQLVKSSFVLVNQNYNHQQLPQIQLTRNYAKSKDKKSEKKGGKKPAKVEVNEEQMAGVINIEQLKIQMEKCIATMRDEFVKNLSLRSTTGAIETLKIISDGKEYELQELGQIIRKNPKTIVINLLGFPQMIPQVLQTLQKSGMNLNPQQDGTTIFIPVPKITKEHRENLAKSAKTLFIKCRDTIKDIQNNHVKKVKKQTEISIDLNHQIQNQITAIADNYIRDAEKLLQIKQGELLAVKE